jgi:hypothetical protein
LNLLLNRDLTSFRVWHVPQTKALAEQKAYSRRGVDRLVETIAHDGLVPAADYTHVDVAITTGEDKDEGFYCAARKLVPDLKLTSSIVISHILKDQWGCATWKSGNRRGIRFPSLADLRKQFDAKHGPQQWPEIARWGNAE